MTSDPHTQPPRIPSGHEIYNQIMGGIEPELTTAGIAELPTKYTDETPETTHARAMRYKSAWHRYREELKVYLANLGGEVSTYTKGAVERLENEALEADQAALDHIEDLMDQVS